MESADEGLSKVEPGALGMIGVHDVHEPLHGQQHSESREGVLLCIMGVGANRLG